MSTSVEGILEVRNSNGEWESLDIFVREIGQKNNNNPLTNVQQCFVEYTDEKGEKKKVLATQTIMYLYNRFLEHCNCYKFLPDNDEFRSFENFLKLCNSNEDVAYKEIENVNEYMKEFLALDDTEKDKRSYEDFLRSVKRDFIEKFNDDGNAKIVVSEEKIVLSTKMFDSIWLGANFRDAINDFSPTPPQFKGRGLPKDMAENTSDFFLLFGQRQGSYAWGHTYFTLDELYDYYNKRHAEWVSSVRKKINEMRETGISRKIDLIMKKLEIKKPKKHKENEDDYCPTMRDLDEDLEFLLEEDMSEVESIYTTYMEMRTIASSAYNSWVSDKDVRLIIFYC